MAVVWINIGWVQLSCFRVVLRQSYVVSRSYFSHSHFLSRPVHFQPKDGLYTRFGRATNMAIYVLAQMKFFRRTLVKNSHSKHTKEYRSNNNIKAKHIRLIDQEGKNLGIITLNEALEKGRKENCMVVEVGRSSSETVCRLITQKQLYEKMKEEKKKHVKTSKTKEIKLTGKISEHDLEVKLKKIIEFLEDRDSVKVFVAHRRLQNTSVDDKKALIEKIAAQISNVGCLQGEVKVVGKGLRAIFVPLQQK